MSTAASLDLTPEQANRLADDIEARAAVDLYAAAPAALGLRTETVGAATLLLAPRVPASYFNRVIGLGGERPATAADVAAILEVYRAAGVVGFWVHLTPTARPPELPRWLEAAGFAFPPRRSWAKFLRKPEQVPSHDAAGFDARLARGDEADAVARVACTAFGLPSVLADWFAAIVGRRGWHVYVVELDGKLIGTGSLFVSGATAWLGIGATLPEYRQRGVQSALLAARIRAGAQLRCEMLATETGESIADEPNPSLNNIRRAGFIQVCSRLNYAASA